VKGVIIRDLMANYFYVYRIFFGRAIPKNRKKKKDSAVVNLMRTGVSARIVSFRENLITFRILFRVTITLDNSVELRDFIDFGAEINYINKATYKQLTGMIIILSLNMEIVSHSNYRVSFIGICKNVRLVIGFI
jgi:hypothetical protein